MADAQDSIKAAQIALAATDWSKASALFDAALQTQDSPEAHDGLGIALWWLNEINASHRHRTQAYIGFKNRGDACRAARIAVWLAREQVFLNSNVNAMQGWFARAERLLENETCVERGWYSLMRASLLATSAQLEETALETLALAHQFKDVDLEAISIAFCGLARVTQGRVLDGLSDLDEAMVAAYSGELSYMTVSEIFCLMLSACEMAGDLVRTEHWCQAAIEYAQERHCAFLSAYCRTTYGAFLTAIGRWHEAESALTEAIRIFDTGHHGLRIHAVIKLADLRVCQGRLEEAEVLLAGYEDLGDSAIPLARLYLARGEKLLARATLEHALQLDHAPSLDQAPHLRLLVDVLLSIGDVDSARHAVGLLAELANQTQSDLFFAQAELAQGQVKRYDRDPEAIHCFESALFRLRAYEQSIFASRARLEMARLVRENDPPAAITWARAALASFQRIGAAHEANEAAQLLRELGVSRQTGRHTSELLTGREIEVYELLAAGLSNREIAGRLVVSPKTVEHHVTSILNKLGVRNRAEAIAFAAHAGPGESAHLVSNQNKGGE
jgi:ATP/maltotriose-dependent transcriptional regulator MalT